MTVSAQVFAKINLPLPEALAVARQLSGLSFAEEEPGAWVSADIPSAYVILTENDYGSDSEPELLLYNVVLNISGHGSHEAEFVAAARVFFEQVRKAGVSAMLMFDLQRKLDEVAFLASSLRQSTIAQQRAYRVPNKLRRTANSSELLRLCEVAPQFIIEPNAQFPCLFFVHVPSVPCLATMAQFCALL